MSELNPYAPPTDDEPEASREPRRAKKSRAWREGDSVVLNKDDARLPKRCVVCNAPAKGERLRKQLTWHPQWVYLLFLAGALFYIIAAAVTRKGATVEFALCDPHKIRRRNGLILLWSGLGVGLALLILAAVADTGSPILPGLLLLIGGPIAGGIMARGVQPVRIDDRRVWLKVGRPFLESIPYRDDD